MQDLQELEQRISLALDRIAQGVEALDGLTVLPQGAAAAEPQAPAADPEALRLAEALQEERDANGQLQERLRVVNERLAAGVAPLEARIATLTAQIDAQGIELGRMKSTNVQLRETLRALREASEKGVSDPQLVNKSLQVELDALRTARATEVAELDGILAELKPLIGEDADA
ncbi:MAG: hypothetical protein GC186_03320 [Rhodobacteraceae bacterium]|nr:hypothetical protein [Paracoccaceae bacterium]